MAKKTKKAAPKAAAPKTPVKIRDRIKEFLRVPGSELHDDPRNFRVHGEAQRKGLKAVLDEVGIADVLLTRRDDAGKLILIDGHLRADVLADQEVPIVVLDVNEAEAGVILATLDHLAGMATIDDNALKALVGGLQIEIPDVTELIASIGKDVDVAIPGPSKTDAEAGDKESAGDAGGNNPPATRWGILVDCTDEMQQQELLDRFDQEGLKCRALVV